MVSRLLKKILTRYPVDGNCRLLAKKRGRIIREIHQEGGERKRVKDISDEWQFECDSNYDSFVGIEKLNRRNVKWKRTVLSLFLWLTTTNEDTLERKKYLFFFFQEIIFLIIKIGNGMMEYNGYISAKLSIYNLTQKLYHSWYHL